MEIKTGFWVAALVRRAELGGAFAAIVRKGDADSGDVLIKIFQPGGRVQLLGGARDGAGEFVWLDLAAGALGHKETAVDAFIARRISSDPDLWVVEIEDRLGRAFVTEPIDPGPPS